MKIALTFDIERDIPNVLDTYFGVKNGLIKILQLLDNYNIKGTFFCTGNVVKQLPEQIKLIASKAHEIACHSINHERLSKLNLEQCQEIISINKKLLEKLFPNSEIIGFRAPFLKPPKFLFRILNNLGFKYDSSVDSTKKLEEFEEINQNIQEFIPSKYSIYFRLPYPFLKRRLSKKELIVLYFHPWEAINMKKVIVSQTTKLNAVKHILFRPDRWFHTGKPFIRRLSNFIEESKDKKAEFITLKQLVNS